MKNNILLCPVCHAPLQDDQNTTRCTNNHCFDYAKQGYLNLFLSGQKEHGDNKEMVLARTRFLNTGAYAFLKDALHVRTSELAPSVCIDLGCGEGWYTQDLVAANKFGFDLSKDALKHASKTDKSTQYVLSSIFHVPLPDACADVIVTCFAPFAKEEVDRLLKPGGHFLFVSPAPRHLFELKEKLYDEPYENIVEPLNTVLSLFKEETHTSTFTLNQEQLQDLFMMTPYAFRTGAVGKDRLSKINDLTLTASFVLREYIKTI